MWLGPPLVGPAHGPVPRGEAVGAIVAERKELVFFQAELNVSSILGCEKSPRSVPPRGIAKDLPNLLAALRIAIVRVALSGAARRGHIVLVAKNSQLRNAHR